MEQYININIKDILELRSFFCLTNCIAEMSVEEIYKDTFEKLKQIGSNINSETINSLMKGVIINE